MKSYSILLTAILFISACGDSSSKESKVVQQMPAQAATAVFDNSLPKGKATDSVSCKEQPGENYALYLPSGYTPNKKYPCIFFFDAHARGMMPVATYNGIAQRYGFVLVGCNMCRNGMSWEESHTIADHMIADCRRRINIDDKNIYVSGFSGGARVASSLAIAEGSIAGVIACGAGFPGGQQPQRKFDFYGMVGTNDFNFWEMEQVDLSLEQAGFAHQLLTFEGKHGWPDAGDFLSAMLWIQIYAMKEGRQSKDDTIVQAFIKNFEQRIEKAKSVKDFVAVHQLTQGDSIALAGLIDITGIPDQKNDVQQQAAYESALQQQTLLQQQEMGERQDIQAGFTAHDAAWWSSKITALKSKAKSARTAPEKGLYQRVLAFTGFVSYMYANRAINSGDYAAAREYLKIFKLAEPDNPDVSYLSAISAMRQGDKVKAITELRQAAKKGYNEKATLLNEPAFMALQGSMDFNDVMILVAANAAEPVRN